MATFTLQNLLRHIMLFHELITHLFLFLISISFYTTSVEQLVDPLAVEEQIVSSKFWIEMILINVERILCEHEFAYLSSK